jgi:hypothetical protein
MQKGCKVALIIFGVIAALAIIAIIVSYIYCEQISTALVIKMVDGVESQVMKDLPQGYEEEEVRATFDRFRSAISGGGLKQAGSRNLEQLGREVKDALADDKVDAEELERILELMREISANVKE